MREIYLLGRFKWYRKWRRGHWELWHINSTILWVKVEKCSLLRGYKVTMLGDEPNCEDYDSF